jgi:lipoteichoic acid synthase
MPDERPDGRGPCGRVPAEQPSAGEDRQASSPSPGRRLLLEFGPLVAFASILTAKWAAVGGRLSDEWFEPGVIVQQGWRTLAALPRDPLPVAGTLGILLLMAAPLILLPRVARYCLLLVGDLSLTLLVYIGLLHIRFYCELLSLPSLALLWMLHVVLPSVAKNVLLSDLAYAADLLLAIALLPWHARACRLTPPAGRRPLVAACAVLVALLLMFPTVARIWRSRFEILNISTPKLDVASSVGLLPYHVGRPILSRTVSRPASPFPGPREVAQAIAERAEARPRSPLFGVARGCNVLVISAESFQSFVLGLELGGKPVAPNLTALARESLDFVNFFDQTPMGTTSDAEILAMQSLHPLAIGVLATTFAEHEYRGLPQILAERGYATLSSNAAPRRFWRRDLTHPNLGFLCSYFEEDLQMRERIGPWLSDREFFTQVAPRIESLPEPSFAYLLTSTSHSPYKMPANHVPALPLGRLAGTELGDYLESVHYVDRELVVLLRRLCHRGLLDRTVLVIYGDHRAFQGDYTPVAEAVGISALDEYGILRLRKRVPLLVRLPRGECAGTREAVGGALDIAPTVLGLLGVADPTAMMLGRDLTSPGECQVVFRDGSFTDGEIFFVNRAGSPTASTCYDFDDGRILDPKVGRAGRAMGRGRLELSDAIVHGDMIPDLTRLLSPALAETAAPP